MASPPWPSAKLVSKVRKVTRVPLHRPAQYHDGIRPRARRRGHDLVRIQMQHLSHAGTGSLRLEPRDLEAHGGRGISHHRIRGGEHFNPGMDGYREMQGIERPQRMFRITVDQIDCFSEVRILDGVMLQPAPIHILNEGREEQRFQFGGQLPHPPPAAQQ